jgi:hypothetical protein
MKCVVKVCLLINRVIGPGLLLITADSSMELGQVYRVGWLGVGTFGLEGAGWCRIFHLR